MAIAEELIAGIISSVLAVLLVEIYLWVRRRYRQRALRWLVGTETAAVVTPVYPWADNAHPAGLLTTYDAIGLAHVLEACNRVGTVPVVNRSGESAENAPLDVIAIGGPSGNQVSATFLKAYCPGFEILTDPETGKLSYRCDGRTFARTDDETFAFIVRLSPKETGLPGTAVIAWGHSAVATASAGYYLARYPNVLRKLGKGSFFVAISVRWVLGYRSFDTRPIDLTAAAFAPPVSATDDAEPAPKSRRFGRSSSRSSSSESVPFAPALTAPRPSESVPSEPVRSRSGSSEPFVAGSGSSEPFVSGSGSSGTVLSSSGSSETGPSGPSQPESRSSESLSSGSVASGSGSSVPEPPAAGTSPSGRARSSSRRSAPPSRTGTSGRSRVAEALDDVRAASASPVEPRPSAADPDADDAPGGTAGPSDAEGKSKPK
ncbi:hypothetical protein [Cryptosporangium aurantiacum]|uniref:Uncharacterized protein n=1 Tax=Cryptosporangium aurantiacum TaxID=134849 RepID=A0A1M7Q2J7_9ACTN|nr:hypothetical protein [Cryptosporangium aurantiacum]SHN24486.1 hypothetical protein SAMN05443668_10470 [Cryptosporangium aurantiacum]